MKTKIRADLHIHSCLSPCGDDTMTPKTMIRKAVEKGLKMIGICDHNSSENVEAFMEASKGTPVRVIPGMEATTKEEVHVVALFPTSKDALEFQDFIYGFLAGENDENKFGNQLLVNKDGEITGLNKRLLIGATDVSIDNMVTKIKENKGIAIASHIDREAYGILAQLGFIPENLKLDALEISAMTTIEEARKRFGEYSHFPFVTSSDAHFPDDIGKAYTEFEMNEATFDELKECLEKKRGITKT